MPRPARPLLAGLLLAALLNGSAAAAAPAPPASPVVDPDCAGQATADAAARVDGGIRGFASFAGQGCGDAIWFFEGGPGAWRASLTPYLGTVMAVADDGHDTFLLYRSGDGVRVARRNPLGFTPGRRLGAGAGAGDIVARGGRWWAVWSASLPGGRARLRQAGTIIGLTDRAPLTAGGGWRLDSAPSLALHGDGRRVLAWERTWPDGRGAIQVATSTGGRWAARTLARLRSVGEPGASPDLQVGAGRTYLVWSDGNEPRLADNRGGGRLRQRPTWDTTGEGPRVAVAGRAVYAAWTQWFADDLLGAPVDASCLVRRCPAPPASQPPSQVVLAGNGHRPVAITADHGPDRRLLALVATGAGATALVGEGGRVLAVTAR